MSIDCFEKLNNDIIETEAINKGLKDLDEGKVIDGEEVMKEIKNKYGFES